MRKLKHRHSKENKSLNGITTIDMCKFLIYFFINVRTHRCECRCIQSIISVSRHLVCSSFSLYPLYPLYLLSVVGTRAFNVTSESIQIFRIQYLSQYRPKKVTGCSVESFVQGTAQRMHTYTKVSQILTVVGFNRVLLNWKSFTATSI